MVNLADPDAFVEGPPYEQFRRLREETPVAWTDAPKDWSAENEDPRGFWSVTRAADITTVSMDPQHYSTWLGGVVLRPSQIGGLEASRMMMIAKDGREHVRQRATVNKVFTPRRVRNLEGQLRDRITTLIDRVAERGECDLMADLASPLVVHMTGDLLGVPEADRDDLMVWAEALSFPDDAELHHEQSGDVMAKGGVYLMGLLQDRLEHPQEDLITALGRATYQGEAMPPGDQIGVFIQLVAAAIDSTRALMSTGMVTLLEHPDQLQALVDDPALIGSAVEEMLRFAPPFNYFRRTARQDTQLGGVDISAGDCVVLWYAAGSRDPEVIDRPDTFDITRQARSRCPHQAFGGGGRHFCLGAGLARDEVRIFFEEFTQRLTDIRLAAPPERVRSSLMNGYKRVPLTFTPIHPGRHTAAPGHRSAPAG